MIIHGGEECKTEAGQDIYFIYKLTALHLTQRLPAANKRHRCDTLQGLVLHKIENVKAGASIPVSETERGKIGGSITCYA